MRPHYVQPDIGQAVGEGDAGDGPEQGDGGGKEEGHPENEKQVERRAVGDVQHSEHEAYVNCAVPPAQALFGGALHDAPEDQLF